MNELDQVWSNLLEDAIEKAKRSGRHSVAEYLNLRATNDALRVAGTRWLFDSFIEIASVANRSVNPISIEREDPHQFPFGGANLSGSILRLRQGIRCLTVEAGWTRTPGDGFMRGGALALARIRHFGMTRSNSDLYLSQLENSLQWFASASDDSVKPFRLSDLEAHVNVLIGHGVR